MKMERKELMCSVIDYAQAYMDGTQMKKSVAKKMLDLASVFIVNSSSPNEFAFIGAGRTDGEKIAVEIFLAIARKMGWDVSGPALEKSRAFIPEMVSGGGAASTAVKEFLSSYPDGTDFRNAVCRYAEELASIVDAMAERGTVYSEDVLSSSRSPWTLEKQVAWNIVFAASRHNGLDVV